MVRIRTVIPSMIKTTRQSPTRSTRSRRRVCRSGFPYISGAVPSFSSIAVAIFIRTNASMLGKSSNCALSENRMRYEAMCYDFLLADTFPQNSSEVSHRFVSARRRSPIVDRYRSSASEISSIASRNNLEAMVARGDFSRLARAFNSRAMSGVSVTRIRSLVVAIYQKCITCGSGRKSVSSYTISDPSISARNEDGSATQSAP